MTCSRFRIHGAVGWLAAAAALASGPAGAAEPIEWTLPNGLKAAVVEDYGADAAAVGIAVRASADCEPAAKAGLRAVLQHAIRASWEKKLEDDDSPRLLLDMEDLGGGLSISTDWEYVGFGYMGAPDRLEDTIAFMAKATFQPEISEEAHQAATELIRGAILGTQVGPADSTIALFRQALVGRPERAYPLGTLETIDRISVADLIAFHHRYYVAGLTGVCIIAPLPGAEMQAMVERAFGELPTGRATVPAPPEPAARSDARVATNPELLLGGPDGLGIASIVVGVPAPGCWDPDLAVAYVIHGLLGGNGALKGRIDGDDGLWAALGLPFPIEEARRNQFVQSIPPPLSANGCLAIHAYASPRRIEDARRAMLAEFEAFADEAPAEDELRRAKEYVRNAYAVLFDMHATRASMLSRAVALGLPDALAPDFARQVDKVTPRDVKRVARRYFTRHAVGVELPDGQE